MGDQDLRVARSVLVFNLFLCCFVIGCLPLSSDSVSMSPGPGDHTITLVVDGLTRSYIVHVPSIYDSITPFPVVIMLHGGGGTAKATIWETGWTKKADKSGFLAVFPNAMSRDPSMNSNFARNPQLWNDGSNRFYTDQKVVDDSRFISALLDDLSSRFNVDKRRIFVTGFSNGASMSFLVGARLSDRIAAIAPVAGACWLDSVVLNRPIPMLYITGNADPLNLVAGGVPKLANGASDKVRGKPKPPVQESILKWVKALDCPIKQAKVSDVNHVHTETYSPGRHDTEVVYITVDELGHTWAGGRSLLPERWVGKTSDRINATDVIWNFFQKHPIPIEGEKTPMHGADAFQNSKNTTKVNLKVSN